MPGPLKIEGVVLRSLRYGEADRILHLYTPQRGRVGAIAKGVRRARSRFGGRLEPFFRLRSRPARGPQRAADGDRAPRPSPATRACASDGGALDAAARACDAVARAVRRPPSRTPAVYNLLCNELALLDAEPGARRRTPTSSPSASSCCSPPASRRSWRACASCGEREHLSGFSGAAGGVVCAACEAGSFPLDEEAHAFLVDALGRPLAEAPAGRRRARCARPSGRSPRRSSTTRASAGARRSPGRIAGSGGDANGSTSSPRARGTCASCSEARAPTSRR